MTREEEIKEAAKQRADQYDHPSKWSDTYYGFIDGAKWADQHPQWIPVDKKLPQENQRVRAWSLTNNEEYLCDYHDGIFEDFYGKFSDGKITHWMEIVPPQGKEE